MEYERTPLKELFGKPCETSDATLNHVIKDIFLSCDVNNAGMVETSTLVEFITPFLQADVTAVAELKKSLDSDDSNPTIDIETFHERMKEWTVKVSGAGSEDFHNIIPKRGQQLDDGDFSLVQSTPMSNFGHYLLKDYVESGIMDLSSCSTYNSNVFTTTVKGPERIILEEYIQKLEHQKKTMADELIRVKAELASTLETNENLQGTLDKTMKKLNSERKLNGQLQSERKREDENEIELSSTKKQVTRLEKSVSTMEKQISELKEELQEMRVENQILEEKNEKIARKNEEALQEVITLQTEIEVCKQKLASAKKVNTALREENRNFQDVIEHRDCEIDKLKFKMKATETILKASSKIMPESSSFLPTLTTSSSFNRTTDDVLTEQELQDVSKDTDSGEDLPVRVHFMATNADTNESLQEEMSKVTSETRSTSSGHECCHTLKCLENEKLALTIQSELMYHIEKQSTDLEELMKLTKDYELKISQLSNDILDLKTQLSLSVDKEAMLLERNKSLEETLQSKKTDIAEISSKLTEYHKFESKCRELEAKIESLENENSVKYVKIVELTIEIDKLKHGGNDISRKVKEESANIEETLEKLKKQKEEIQFQKIQLQDQLKLMEEERVSLKIEIQTLLTKIMNLEENARDLVHEKSTLQIQKDKLKSENENLLIRNSTIEINLSEFEENFHKLEAQKEMIESENDALKNENENLRKDIERLQSEAVSTKSSSSTLEKEQRDLIELSFKLKLENLDKEKIILCEDRRRLSDEIKFVNQERDNMLQEIRRLRKQLRYQEEEFEMQLDKSRKDFNSCDAVKLDMEEDIKRLKKELQEFSSLKFMHEQLIHRYEKLEQELAFCTHKMEENVFELSSLKTLQEKYEDLQDNFRKNNEEVLVLKSEKEALNSQIEKLKTQVEECKSKLEEYKNIKEAQNEKLQKTIIDKNDIQNELQQLKKDLSGLLQKNEEIVFNLEKARSESTMFRNDKYSLQREHERLKDKLHEFEELQTKYQELSRIFDKNKKEHDILRVTHDICEQNRKELNEKCTRDLHSYHVELAKIEDENENLQRENFDLKSKINTLDGENFQLKEKISYYHTEKHHSGEIKYNLARENKDLSAKLEKNELNSKKQDIENKQLSVENFDLRMQIEKSETAIASYLSMNDKLKASNDELDKIVQKKDELISELKSELESLKTTNQALNMEVNNLLEITQDMEDTKINLKQKESIISEIENETIILKESKQNLNEEVFILREMCENHKHKLENNEIRVKALEDLVKRKDDVLENRELKIKELKREIERQFEEFKEMNQQVEKLKEANEEMKISVGTEKKISEAEIENRNKIVLELEESKDRNATSRKIIEILELDVKALREEMQGKSSNLSNLEQQMSCLFLENKALKEQLQHPGDLINKLKELSKENEVLREDCQKFCIQDKAKMIEETNRSFSDALQKMYTTEKNISENEEDFSEYCQKEIEKYKIENERFKCEIAALLEEKRSIVNRLKCAESERETTKNKLEGLLTEKESWLSQKIYPKTKDSNLEICERCKSDSKLLPKWSNFDKLNIRKEKLEQKVHYLEEQLQLEKQALAKVLSKKSAVEKELEDFKVENSKLRVQLRSVDDEIEALKKETKIAMEKRKKKTYTQEEMNDLAKNLNDHKQKLCELSLRLEEEGRVKMATFSKLHQLRESLSQNRFKLERYTLSVATGFKVPEGLLRKIVTAETILSQTSDCLLHLDKEIYRTREQIDITSNVLDYMVTRKAKTIFHAVGSQTENVDANKLEQRRQRSNTFTLRPATLDPKQYLNTGCNPVEEICILETLRFASSGDAGRSRDLGVLYPRRVESAAESSETKDEELQDQDASPALNENILEDLGLLQRDFNLTGMPDQELEDKFDRVAVAFTVDSASLKTRYSSQATKLTLKEEQLASELAACKTLFENFLGGEQLNNVLTHLESVFRRCTQISVSAMLFGSLKHERQVSNCAGLMIQYAACLRKRLDSVADRLRLIGQHVKVAGTRQLQLTDFDRAVPQLNMRSTSTQSMGLQRSLPMEIHISPRPISRIKQIAIKCFFAWIVFVTICCLFLLSMLHWDGDSVYVAIPWSWKSFDEPWAPFVRKRYMHGPPPT